MGKLLDRLFRSKDDLTEEQRDRLYDRIQALITKWEPRLGVRVREFNLRKMKTYWGSTDPHAGKITFDTKLADMSPRFLEVTVVHEMMHLRTKDGGHNDEFYRLMDKHVPGWRKLHDQHACRMTPQS